MSNKSTSNTRAIAAEIIIKLKKNTASLAQFDNLIKPYSLSREDRNFLWQLCFETSRYYHYYKSLANKFIQINKTKEKVLVLIIIGLIQLDRFNQPDYATISETVNAAKVLKISWATKLINAVLRKFQQHKKTVIDQSDLNHLSLPKWLYQHLQKDYPNCYQIISKDLLNDAQLYLRINQSKTSLDNYCDILTKNHIQFDTTPNFTNCITVNRNTKITELPFYNDGFFSVQDLSAQQFINLLPINNDDYILDACAAPGGKTSYLLEKYDSINLTAIDNDQKRINRLNSNIERLQLNTKNIKVICDDATNIDQWFDGNLFDHIILDAPCSATGVIRRHPDIKLTRSEKDIQDIMRMQQKLLQSLWALLKPGGNFLYITCSLLQDENDHQVGEFLKQNKACDAQVQDISINLPGQKQTYGYQIFPKTSDGFYYSLLKKV